MSATMKESITMKLYGTPSFFNFNTKEEARVLINNKYIKRIDGKFILVEKDNVQDFIESISNEYDIAPAKINTFRRDVIYILLFYILLIVILVLYHRLNEVEPAGEGVANVRF